MSRRQHRRNRRHRVRNPLRGRHALLERLEELSADEAISSRSQERLRDLYEERLERYESGLEAGEITEEYQESSASWSRWRRELFVVEREAVVDLRDEGKISAEVMRRVERDIDLEELRFSG